MRERSELGASLAGLDLPGLSGPDLLVWVADRAFSGVRLDARNAAFRPRSLDRSARRGLAATIRRLELAFDGVDLWIPPEHFKDQAKCAHAIDAVTNAIEFSNELRGLVVNGSPSVGVHLPDGVASDLLMHIAAASNHHHVPVADHTWPLSEQHELAVGIDPAAIILRGGDPCAEVAANGARVACARLSDADQATRVTAGAKEGHLDLAVYRASLSVGGVGSRVVADFRGITQPDIVCEQVKDAWERAAFV